MYIKASGEGEITAGDIEHSSDVEILNPELTLLILIRAQRLLWSSPLTAAGLRSL
jgi:DNA-directed RNA polymerase alpha subunit